MISAFPKRTFVADWGEFRSAFAEAVVRTKGEAWADDTSNLFYRIKTVIDDKIMKCQREGKEPPRNLLDLQEKLEADYLYPEDNDFSNSDLKEMASALREATLSGDTYLNSNIEGAWLLIDDIDPNKVINDFRVLGQYNPEHAAKFFAAAYMSGKTLEQYSDLEHFEYKDAQQKQALYRKVFEEYAANGGDIETIRLMLNKQERATENDLTEFLDNEHVEKDLERLEELRLKAEGISSPYDRLFNESESIVRLKKLHDKQMLDPSVPSETLDVIENQIYQREDWLRNECAKYDPEMLKQVASARQENLKINKNLVRDGIVNASGDDYQAAQNISKIGDKMIRERESVNFEN